MYSPVNPSSKNINCGYSLEPPLTCTDYVLSRNMKNIRILSETFSFFFVLFFVVKFSVYLSRHIFVCVCVCVCVCVWGGGGGEAGVSRDSVESPFA